MLNSVSVGSIYAIQNPVLNLWNQQRVAGQIQSNNFEQVSLRPVSQSSAQSAQQQISPRDDAAEQGAVLEALRYRPDRPLVQAGTLQQVNPVQAAASFRRVNDLLVSDAQTRDPANRIRTVNVYI
ncbi:MAG: hypothetical protein HQM04_00105 [Magnetococcales bacterium]|nr:hypothetical protein [Magnetococcales bacterium]MBF0113423.1 hypothetical protein [Magnetococcales bacterium]